MRTTLYKFLLPCFILCLSCMKGQDTVRVLFIGNSFTFFHNMPQMVQAFASEAGFPMKFSMHAPGGISVGDLSQGNQAHMNNPVLYGIIRSNSWDVVVIQDNQGRFVLDSALFPSVSKVVEGHHKLMDSVKKYNSCAKVVLFSGWAFKNGMPPYGNTGSDMIRRISVNYRVLNSGMKEVIAPIGEAWIYGIQGLPLIDLWDPDAAHPSLAGNYLTASVIYATIFGKRSASLAYNAGLNQVSAALLRGFGDSAVFHPGNYKRYNLGGMQKLLPTISGNDLICPASFTPVMWYKDGVAMGQTGTLSSPGNGTYWLHATDAGGSYVKGCRLEMTTTGFSETSMEELAVYPNPVNGGLITIRAPGRGLSGAKLISSEGENLPADITLRPDRLLLKPAETLKGVTVLVVTFANGEKRFIKLVP